MEDNIRRRIKTAKSRNCHGNSIFKKSRPKLQILDLPEDVLCTILSALPLKDVVRTSVLSSKWRSVHKINPKLRFDSMTMCSSSSTHGSDQYTQEFIRNVNAVLQQHKGNFVEHFEIKFGLNGELVIHLDNWVGFVVASHVKNLALDLIPANFRGRNDRYLLPSELLKKESTSCLRNLQLSFVSIKLPAQFSGFPNIRKLDLQSVDVTFKDLEDMVSSCSNLEWLSIVRCHLDDELKIDLPLPRLLYLCVAYCRITRIKFNAMKLKTFDCRGGRYPIDLIQSLELKDANLHYFDSITLENTLTTLPTVLPSVESLNLRATATLKTPTLLESPCKFSQLKYLQLELYMVHEDACNILSLASFLRASPLLEKFELHICVCSVAHFSWLPIRSLPLCPHNHLKKLYITGFTACTGQLEFLIHIVENAPVLEVLTLDPAFKSDKENVRSYEGQTDVFFSRVREISRRHLSGRISPATELYIL
ncbi:hypothetical protein BS78_10G079300 [Paspalum vaginatum]|nr:hypothetical protein BS78_10G079300 [Paspalum vaginatum]